MKTANKKLIAIKLPRKCWEEIAAACIYIADWYELETGNKIPLKEANALRKTYYQIKAELY